MLRNIPKYFDDHKTIISIIVNSADVPEDLSKYSSDIYTYEEKKSLSCPVRKQHQLTERSVDDDIYSKAANIRSLVMLEQ